MENLTHTHYYGESGTSIHSHPHEGAHIHTTEKNRNNQTLYQEGPDSVEGPNIPEYVSRTSSLHNKEK